MVAIGPESPAPTDDAVVRSREPNGQPRHPARERHAVVCFDDEMRVIALNREVHHAKPRSRRCAESAAKREKYALRSHARQTVRTSERHVNRVTAMVRATSFMRDAAAWDGTPALSTNGECEVELLHVDLLGRRMDAGVRVPRIALIGDVAVSIVI
jgi:hypothetical protein